MLTMHVYGKNVDRSKLDPELTFSPPSEIRGVVHSLAAVYTRNPAIRKKQCLVCTVNPAAVRHLQEAVAQGLVPHEEVVVTTEDLPIVKFDAKGSVVLPPDISPALRETLFSRLFAM